MIRGSGGSGSLNERLRSFSSRYSNQEPDEGGFVAKRQEELRVSSSTRKYDRDSQDREKDPGSRDSPDSVGSTPSSRYRREGSSGREERRSYYGSNNNLSSSSSSTVSSSGRYVPLADRERVLSTDRERVLSSNGHGADQADGNVLPSRLSTKREARDAFFTKNDQMSAPKFDPSLLRERERDKEREKEKLAYSGNSMASSHSHGPTGTTGHGPGSKEIEGYVGFANLPNQVYRKSVKRGFEFTLMVVGESGLGKSTLINSMFLADLYSAEYPGPSLRIKKTVNVDPTQVLLKEGGVQLRLTVVDTPGFGDAVDNSNCWQPVIDFIESKYDEYLNAESRVNRKTMPDNRVHCCLYFISPNGHGLKPLDVEFMKRLHDKVNIIPLIAKADTLTPDECREFKKTILNEIAQHKIKIYEFPDADDEEENKLQKKLKDRVPFAVVGSNTVVESQGRKVRGRMYPWGIVEVENLEHNDFIALRNMLIRTYLQDLKDVTNNVHYENFRYNKLASVTSGGKNKNTSGKSPTSPLAPVPAARRRRFNKSISSSGQSRSTTNLTEVTSDPDSNNNNREKQRSCGDLRAKTPPPGLGSYSGYSPVSSPKSPLSPGQASVNGYAMEPADGSTYHTLPKPPPRSSRHRSSSSGNSTTNLLLETPLRQEEIKKRGSLLLSLSGREKNPLLMMEDERREHVAKMKKMEAEMEQVFEMKVKEKKHKLKESEIDLQRRAEQMKKSLEQQQKELEEKRRAFEKERAVWEEQQRQLEEQRRRSLENAKDNTKKDKKKSLF